MGGMGGRHGKDHTAVAQKNAADGIKGLSRQRHRFVKNRVPEKQLQQYRDVLHDLDVARRQLGHQPIGRKPFLNLRSTTLIAIAKDLEEAIESPFDTQTTRARLILEYRRIIEHLLESP